MKTRHGFQQVGDVEVFYREAGPSDAPVILLLHGTPSAGHMFRDLIPLLSDCFRIIGSAKHGYGQSRSPTGGELEYSFDNLAGATANFTEAMSRDQYALHISDYGAPVGLRRAMRHPDRL